jgi:hypothetical protein
VGFTAAAKDESVEQADDATSLRSLLNGSLSVEITAVN